MWFLIEIDYGDYCVFDEYYSELILMGSIGDFC